MKSTLIKAFSALLAAALVLGAIAFGISSMFNAEIAEADSKTPPVLQSLLQYGDTAPVGEVPETEEDNIYDNLDLVVDNTTLPSLSPNGSVLMGGITMPAMPEKNESASGNNNTGSNNNDNGNNNGNGNGNNGTGNSTTTPAPEDNDKPQETPVTTPTVSSSQLINTLLSRNYGSGIQTFGNISGADTSALYNAIHKGSNTCSFIAIRLSDGASVTYNVNRTYRCASSYKSFVSLYTYKQAAAGALNMNTGLKYTYADYYGGSGIIKSSAIGTVYTLRQIADYSIRYSDNIAFTMLQRYINRDGLVEYAKSLGCPNAEGFEYSWPNVSALDAAIWWADLYAFSKSSALGAELYNVCLNATNPSLKKALNGEHPVAHKSGSMSYYFHDCGIVESEDPYLIAVYTHNPYNYSSTNQTYFSGVVQAIDAIINP